MYGAIHFAVVAFAVLPFVGSRESVLGENGVGGVESLAALVP